MSAISIYHNPRCSKSRQTLALLEQQGIKPEIIEYLKIPPTPNVLNTVLNQLGINARELLRKGEAAYKELNLADKTLTNQQLIQAMCEHPKLIERPIVIHNNKAKIGRPPEAVLEII
ncbi:MAG: arsenate reductase (glutaredoxin) [Gammaproteobacteria bacterium]|nr:MAG: arsenate reductase (glutaredoxin) [Gammaproteobacteria bacterium]RKZ90755.1 MAG: arsenate reductase (glutaredoxin) [Gammaproteobacteria bacterium]RKZ97421.1 MAG: arsenate reductase (glutaredoxin) [Gammaproteobacteria bacterium]RKZ98036.1 MAG: arsenate reductase (glutaredoxin) [Gammaproteobacteria bacterium]